MVDCQACALLDLIYHTPFFFFQIFQVEVEINNYVIEINKYLVIESITTLNSQKGVTCNYINKYILFQNFCGSL